MATYYVEPETGGGTPAGSGTEGDPWNGFGNITGLADDDILILSAGTFAEQLVVQDVNVTVRGQGVGVTVIDGEDTRATCVTISSGASGMSYLEDMTCTRGAQQGVLLRNNNSADYGVTVRRVHATNCTQNPSTQGQATGFQINNANNRVTTAVFEDCVAHGNGRIGFDSQQFQGTMTRRRCIAYNNGALGAGGGFYTHPWRGDVSGSWTSQGGGVYSRAKASALDGFSGVYHSTAGVLLRISDPPTTTPAEGFCSADSSNVYIHLSGEANPGTDSFKVSRADVTFVDEDCVSYSNGGADTQHGSGFHYDDLSQNVTSRRNYAYDNGGKGFRCFLVDNATIDHCLVVNCGLDAETESHQSNMFMTGYGISVRNCTSVSPLALHVMASQNAGDPLVLQNVIMSGGAGKKAMLVQNNGAITDDSSIINGCSTIADESNGTITSTNQTEADPLLDSEYKPQSSSPAIGSGLRWWADESVSDLSGTPMSNDAPDIGAYQVGVPSTTAIDIDGLGSVCSYAGQRFGSELQLIYSASRRKLMLVAIEDSYE